MARQEGRHKIRPGRGDGLVADLAGTAREERSRLTLEDFTVSALLAPLAAANTPATTSALARPSAWFSQPGSCPHFRTEEQLRTS